MKFQELLIFFEKQFVSTSTSATTNSRGRQQSDINGHLQHLSDVCRSQQTESLAVELFAQEILMDTIFTLGCSKEVPEHTTAKNDRLNKAEQSAEIQSTSYKSTSGLLIGYLSDLLHSIDVY